MKRTLLFLIFLLYSFHLFSQIGFNYDDAGNRISRYIIELKNTEDVDEEVYKQLNFSISKKRNILVFPNPTKGILTIEIIDEELNEDTLIQMNIYTLKGDLVSSKDYSRKAFEIDLSDKPSGMYLMDIYIGYDKHNFMIVKD